MLGNKDNRNKLKVCKPHCFSTTMKVTGTRLNVTLHVHCLSYSFGLLSLFRVGFLVLRLVRLVGKVALRLLVISGVACCSTHPHTHTSRIIFLFCLVHPEDEDFIELTRVETVSLYISAKPRQPKWYEEILFYSNPLTVVFHTALFAEKAGITLKIRFPTGNLKTGRWLLANF
jgi:hypothetical protein